LLNCAPKLGQGQGKYKHIGAGVRGRYGREMVQRETALVLFSGGQDSTACLAWALDRHARVETVGFDYGQRHIAEMSARPRVLAALRNDFPQWQGRLGEDHVLPIDTIKAIGGSALTENTKIEMGANGLPTTFVPGRNIFFLAAAAALAYRRGIRDLVGGMCETDFSGYPDCRDETVQAVARALSLGLARQVTIHTPLMWIDKAATWKLAEELGGPALVDLIVEETVTCYEGDPSPHDWGRGCGQCPACELRAAGFEKYRGATANPERSEGPRGATNQNSA
jgi:7-cyano-7-deazaguanine synthase